ncbi:MAG: beta-N-acetylhexosaminidase [Frankiales bacterium]|nr:beta-N-acetylhexosaminidase [Frankiales bacterium]
MPADLVPRPSRHDTAEGHFPLSRSTTVGADDDLAGAARWFTTVVGAATGVPLTAGNVALASIRFAHDSGLPDEGYRLTVTPQQVEVAASTEAGAFYGAQTLRQLLGPDAFRRSAVTQGPWVVPACTIEDAPRFPWRGCLLDVARHFQPKDAVLRFVDLMAAHKLNVLHLHLTDDQGWRIEIVQYPELTRVGAWRTHSMLGRATPDVFDDRPHGGYYTQADLREIVAYAAARHITVVPEIDVPGHTQAAIASYPELGNLEQRLDVWTFWGINDNVLNVEEATVGFFRNVLDEVVGIFPSTYISLGGDEVPTGQWEESYAARARLLELNLFDATRLEAWFLSELAVHLRVGGRRIAVWDELVDKGLPPGALVQSWRGLDGALAALRAGHEVVMCPEQHLYLDHRQSDHPDEPVPVGFVRTLEDVYGYEPMPLGLTEEEQARVLGAQAQIWTEHLDNPRRVDYAAFPRLVAFAEAVWSDPAHKDKDDFVRRLTESHLARLDALGVEYRPLDGPHPWQTRPGVAGRPQRLPEAGSAD